MRRAIKQSEISGARRRCNRNDRFLMWRERLTGKCLRSKRSPDGMHTVYWRREVQLNPGESRDGVLFLAAAGKHTREGWETHTKQKRREKGVGLAPDVPFRQGTGMSSAPKRQLSGSPPKAEMGRGPRSEVGRPGFRVRAGETDEVLRVLKLRVFCDFEFFPWCRR